MEIARSHRAAMTLPRAEAFALPADLLERPLWASRRAANQNCGGVSVVMTLSGTEPVFLNECLSSAEKVALSPSLN